LIPRSILRSITSEAGSIGSRRFDLDRAGRDAVSFLEQFVSGNRDITSVSVAPQVRTGPAQQP
jgi:hypothetical protein